MVTNSKRIGSINHMKKVLIIILFAVSLTETMGQGKGQKFFKMPANVKYQRGRALVKIKNEYKDEISQWAIRNSTARVKKR